MKLNFESNLARRTQDGDRDLKNLAEKIRSRFRVNAAAILSDHSGSDAIAIAALGSSAEKLSQLLDAIVDFCEQSGLGRIDNEETLLDHIDAIAEYDHGS